MRTVGQILKETREAKLYSLEDVEKATKIRKELLIELEADNYQKLPPATFVQGFIKNYARFLKLDSNKLLAVFRREFSDKLHHPYVMETFTNPLEETRLKLTPSRAIWLAVALIIICFFAYLWLQYRQFVGPPTLLILVPSDQQSVESETLTVIGKTEPEIKVTVNGQEISVDSEGNFKENINLDNQVNKIDVVAISKFGQKTEIERTVYLKK